MKRLAIALFVLIVFGVGAVFGLNLAGEAPIPADAAPPAMPAPAEQIARGAYLARAGNCIGCHTAPGGAPMAGGVGVETPFGTVQASNLTPDDATGLGRWSSAHFWRALHHGRSADGRLLYPAFPYTSYTHLRRSDADALYAWLRSLPAVNQPRPAHDLRFPYDSQAALAVWRAMFFRAGPAEPPATPSTDLARGAYLVQALGHCSACHSARNALGATPAADELGGGLIPVQNWYAPSLASGDEAGVADWDVAQIVALLKTGTVPDRSASVGGPMAQVVFNSTQHLSDADLNAMALYLKALPQTPVKRPEAKTVDATQRGRGGALYEQHCIACHGAQGEGAPGAYPALAGNRAVTMASPANLVRIVLQGGFAPTTAGNPRPYGMPPFATVLKDDDVAAVLTYLRTSWGNTGAPVSALDVNRLRR
jgi:mono/diheme cytochrome c family protein